MDMLHVKKGKIVDAQGNPVLLRGTCVGGWMNMENFINGYPGAEHRLRALMAEIMGPDKATFFFERLLDYFLTEDDIAFMKKLGATVVRLPLNYRHFESDENPFHYLEPGFERLDRAIKWCEKHGLYVILDLHAVQGWQNTDWHCDNATRRALLWEHKLFQDRFVGLWEVLAEYYEGNATVAGYNLMNEPHTNGSQGRFGNWDDNQPDSAILNAVYRRTVDAIRSIDPDHIIFLEGDYYAQYFDGMAPPFADNLVYSSHNYTAAGFGPGRYPGELRGVHWDYVKLEQGFLAHQGTEYTQHYGVPLWVGEFGATYNGPEGEVSDRMRALNDQLAVFNAHGAHWTTWTYKDIGVMGWVRLDPQSDYLRIIEPVLEAKRKLHTDFWMGWLPTTPADELIERLAQVSERTLADPDINHRANVRYLSQATLAGYVGGLMQPAYARLFQGMSEGQIDQVLQAFAFKNCKVHPQLTEVMKARLKEGS
jgi:aryl-phospho-beta-D-glucosidase BglC (GH1 family)